MGFKSALKDKLMPILVLFVGIILCIGNTYLYHIYTLVDVNVLKNAEHHIQPTDFQGKVFLILFLLLVLLLIPPFLKQTKILIFRRRYIGVLYFLLIISIAFWCAFIIQITYPCPKCSSLS